MNSLLIASHQDLLIYDPLKIHNILNANNKRLIIFLPNISRLKQNNSFYRLVKKYGLKIELIPDIESDENVISKLFFIYKNFFQNNEIDNIYICNPLRLHCYVAFLSVLSLKLDIPFLFYQGSISSPKGLLDHGLYRFIHTKPNLRFLTKLRITQYIARLIYFIRRNLRIILLLKSSHKLIKELNINFLEQSFILLFNQGIPLSGIVAHDKIGFESILKDLPWHQYSILRSNNLILSEINVEIKNKSKNLERNIYFLPSLITEHSLFSAQEISIALKTWISLFKYLKSKFIGCHISIKLHPREENKFLSKSFIKQCNDLGIDQLPSQLYLDEFIDSKSIVLTDHSTVLSYCAIYGINSIAFQSKETCGSLYYYLNMPLNFTENMHIVKSKESLLELLKTLFNEN